MENVEVESAKEAVSATKQQEPHTTDPTRPVPTKAPPLKDADIILDYARILRRNTDSSHSHFFSPLDD